MDDRQKAAVDILAAGGTVEEAANAASRTTPTIYKWLDDGEFQTSVLRGIRGLAILALAQYLKHGEDPKAGQAALATLRWLGAGKPRSARRAGPEVEDDETDLGEFSEESLRRLKGED